MIVCNVVKRFGLPKEYILSNVNDIDKVFKQGLLINSQSFSLFFCQSSQTKVLFTASKFIKKKIKKNKAKRILRELFRKNKAAFPKNLSFAFIAKKQIFIIKYTLLEAEFIELADSIFHRIN